MDDYDVHGVWIMLELESGEELQVATPFDHEELMEALDRPSEDNRISEWVSELHLASIGATDPDDLVSNWYVPDTI